MTKTEFRYYTIADYEEEERWLREQHRSGWRLARLTPPGFYVFESCEPADVIYRLDYKNDESSGDYLQMARDFGWEYVLRCVGWLYFRKPAEEAESEAEGELFSDNGSRVEMVSRIVKTRFLPLAVIFLCCVLPNLLNAFNGYMGGWSGFFGAFFGVMFVFYVWLIVHCGRKLKELREKYED